MLDSINKEMERTHMGRKKDFIKSRMLENQVTLRRAEDSLVVFQQKNGLIEIKTQTEESIKAMGEAERNLLMAEMSYFIDSTKFLMNDPHSKEKSQNLAAMRSYLAEISLKKGHNVLLPVAKLPASALAFERLKRSIFIMNTLDQYLTKEYEAANLEEKSTIPTLGVLDSAFVPQKRVKPKRTVMVLIITGFGVIAGILSSIALGILIEFDLPPPLRRRLGFILNFARSISKTSTQ
jgi:uncharacterized protein involved in exopolysaccharide biosynthesis